jgi:two-component system, OmpR family, KDP operon response regulator KdpE
MARVLIVEDEAQIVSAVTRGLSREGNVVASADSGEDALAEVAARPPDLVVLDLGLPDLDGIEVIRRLRSWSEVPVLVLSARGAERSKVDALDAGADDYLDKPFGLPELRARVRALLRRASVNGRVPAMVVGDLSIDSAHRTVTLAGTEVRLTPKEWRLLDVLSAHPGKLLTHGWLIQQVWGRSHGDETRQTLRTHLRTLRAKLGDDADAPRLVRTETGAGYRWLVTPEDTAT